MECSKRLMETKLSGLLLVLSEEKIINRENSLPLLIFSVLCLTKK